MDQATGRKNNLLLVHPFPGAAPCVEHIDPVKSNYLRLIQPSQHHRLQACHLESASLLGKLCIFPFIMGTTQGCRRLVHRVGSLVNL